MANRRAHGIGMSLVAAVAVSCSGGSDGTSGARSAVAAGMSGTSVRASKTATGFYEHRIDYDWSVEKRASQSSMTVRPGSSDAVDFTIQVTRVGSTERDVFGVRGQIYVMNHGAVPTEGLTIHDEVRCNLGSGGWVIVASQDITPSVQLAAGDWEYYDYDIEFTSPVAPGTHCRNTAHVTITNHSGHLGEPFGPSPSANFDIPAAATEVRLDTAVDVSDAPSCPSGYACTPSTSGPWHFTGDGSVTYSITVRTPSSAICGTTVEMNNTATLTELDSGRMSSDSESVSVYTGDCTFALFSDAGSGDDGGVTYQGCTPGYWKNHIDSWPAGYGPSTPLEGLFGDLAYYGLSGNTCLQALEYMGGETLQGAAQILLRAAVAAVLNAASSGVSYSESAGEIMEEVQAALASHDRSTILTLARELDGYNNAGCPLH